MKKRVILLAMMIAVLSLNACGAKRDEGKDNKENKEQVAVTKPADNIYAPSEVAQTEEYSITYVSGGEYTSTNEFVYPMDGNEFYRAEFKIENTGSQDISFSSVDFACYADGATAYEVYPSDDALSATIAPGETVTGALYYEVSASAQKITLECTKSFWSYDKIIFEMK